ncbi:hypothetical protein GCM10027359_07210 [Marilutibacter aestuarii]
MRSSTLAATVAVAPSPPAGLPDVAVSIPSGSASSLGAFTLLSKDRAAQGARGPQGHPDTHATPPDGT